MAKEKLAVLTRRVDRTRAYRIVVAQLAGDRLAMLAVLDEVAADPEPRAGSALILALGDTLAQFLDAIEADASKPPGWAGELLRRELLALEADPD